VLDEAVAEQIRAEAADVMRRGIAEAEAEPPGDVSLVFEHAHADALPQHAEELRELKRILGG
jgi:hypothetical protein